MSKRSLIALAFFLAINASAQQNPPIPNGTSSPSSAPSTTHPQENGGMFLDTTDKGGINFAGGADTTTDALGKSQTFQVDGLGHTLKATDAYSNPIVTNLYDARELLEESTDGAGRMTDWVYDARQLVIQRFDGLDKATTFTYDVLKRLTGTTSPLSSICAQTFDANGNKTAVTNALSKMTLFSFDLGFWSCFPRGLRS
jgi:YD repeat-containing protein